MPVLLFPPIAQGFITSILFHYSPLPTTIVRMGIDLTQMMIDMKPKFLRFPGGNFLEGPDVV